MARDTRSRNLKTQDGTASPGVTVQLQGQKRFFDTRPKQSSGERTASALAKAFGAGADALIQRDANLNAQGRKDATRDFAKGSVDEENKNRGYNQAVIDLEDERSIHLMREQLPAFLEENDAENLDEAGVSALVSKWMENEHAGILDDETEDHSAFIQELVNFETEIIAAKRDSELLKWKEAKRTDTYENFRSRYLATKTFTGEPAVDYKYLADQTNTFFDGAEKKTAYWEMLYALANETGDPSIIEDAPDRFENKDPTGKNDPFLQEQHEAAIKSSRIRAGTIAVAEQKEIDDASDAAIIDLQVQIVEAAQNGESTDRFLKEIMAQPTASFKQYTAAVNFANAQTNRDEKRSPKQVEVSTLWNGIHNGTDGLAEVMNAYSDGALGGGNQAIDTMNSMMKTVTTIGNKQDTMLSADANTYRNLIDDLYNPSLEGILGSIDPILAKIKVQANLKYVDLLSQGMAPKEAFENVSTDYDAVVDRARENSTPDIHTKSISNFQDKEILDIGRYMKAGDNIENFNKIFAGVRPDLVNAALIKHIDSGQLSPEQIANLINFVE